MQGWNACAPASMQMGRHMLGGMPPHAVYSASLDLGTPTACGAAGTCKKAVLQNKGAAPPYFRQISWP